MDLVAFGAHPDDVELFAGGFIAQSVAQGYEVGLVHLTRGERGTRGTPEERRAEALQAAQVLGVGEDRVAFLDLGDTLVENTEANRLEVIRVLREWRPRVVLHGHPLDRHPDHRKGCLLVQDACYYSGLARVETGQPPWRPEKRLEFLNNTLPSEPPAFIVDITPFFPRKIESLRAYRSQFHNPDYDGPQTFISTREFFDQIEVRARFYGGQIGVRYGEPFMTTSPLGLTSPLALFLNPAP